MPQQTAAGSVVRVRVAPVDTGGDAHVAPRRVAVD